MNAPISTLVAAEQADLADAGVRARIDDYVRAHPRATPFHLTGWNVAVARACGQTAHCLIAQAADGEIAGVLPLTEIRSPLFGKALVSTGFAVDGGILTRRESIAEELAAAAWSLAEKIGCPSLELRGGPAPGEGWIVDDTTYLGFARDLAGDDDAELLAIPRKQRAEVRKSLDADLQIAIGNWPNDLAMHYEVFSQSVRNLGTPVFPAKLFREVAKELGDHADIVTVTHRGTPHASVFSLYLNGIVYPFWGGGTREARALKANDRLYYELMCHARRRACTRYDFGRSKAGTGVAAFKKNWGFEGVPLRYAKRVADGAAPRETNPMSPKYRLQVALWKKLPLWLANAVGPVIAKGLG
ncbi:FemAB family XrtA/PEP-CTERM system-associated protein [Sphingomonas sp.]|uniref:FemAB family XrtA/PEP-CTERM system-associated protein n=1 Tax=Sphingomonas sp. TaxID=28214 RepID=UPI002E34EFDA|nr:FemAB family XrtA/PEP-CTERM system-associated protein [Sphingomonas sp.]HEX4693935.1 FemAB family XrtA/PEP-CTERM system-associated protein [Sphingomonas sp.]